jgi:hypothetical protein
LILEYFSKGFSRNFMLEFLKALHEIWYLSIFRKDFHEILYSRFLNYFHEMLYLSIFRNPVQKIQVTLKSDKNNGTLHENRYTFLIIFCSILLRTRNTGGADKFLAQSGNKKATSMSKSSWMMDPTRSLEMPSYSAIALAKILRSSKISSWIWSIISGVIGLRNYQHPCIIDKGVEKIKTHMLCSVTFFPKIVLFMK